MSANVKIMMAAEKLMRLALKEMKKSHQAMGPILTDGRSTEDFLQLERESTKMLSLSQATLATRKILGPEESPTAIEEVRAAWAELQKWSGISLELSDAFQAFDASGPAFVRTPANPQGFTTRI